MKTIHAGTSKTATARRGPVCRGCERKALTVNGNAAHSRNAHAIDGRNSAAQEPSAGHDAGAPGFSGRVPEPLQRQRRDRTEAAAEQQLGSSLPLGDAARTAWRAALASLASAVVLQGSLLPGAPPPPQPPHSPGGDARSAAALLLLLTQPPAALAAADGSSTSGAAAKMERVRQLATPDVAGMKEVSEELASREAPPGAVVTPAAGGSGGGGGGGGKQQQSDPKSKLKAADLAALLRVSPATAQSLLASERELGRLSVGAAAASFQAAAELLGLSTPSSTSSSSSAAGAGAGAAPSAPGGLTRQAERGLAVAGRLLSRQPRVLLVPAAELRARFGELQSLLLVPVSTARKLVAAQPGLLSHSPEVLRARLSGLCGTFNVDTQLASQLAVHEPALLAANAAELSARASALAAELGLTRPQAVAVVRRHPRALLVPADAMRSRLRKLAEALEVPRGAEGLGRVVLNAPRLVLLGEGEVDKGLEGLRGLLKISRDRAVEVAAEVPALLTTPAPVLAERLKTLAELAGVPAGQMRALVADKPSLLTKTSTAMKRAVAEAEAEEAGAGAEAQAGRGKGGSK